MKLTAHPNGRIYARLKTGNPAKPYVRMTLGTTSLEDAKRKAKEANLPKIEAALQAGQLSQQAISRLTTGGKQSCESVSAEWLESQTRRGRSPATTAKSAAVLSHWFAQVPAARGLAPMAINEEHIDPFINRADPAAGYATRQRELSVLRTFFDYCASFGFCTGNPAGKGRAGVNHRALSHEQREKKTVSPFTSAEVHRLLANTEDWDRWAIGIAAATGLRLGDIATIEHASFAVPGHLIVWTAKRDRRVCLPINDRITPGLATILAEIPPTDSPYLFPEAKEQYDDIKTGRPKFSVYFGRLLQRLGIEGKSFHSLRHYAITRWHRQGFDLDACKTFAGHTSTKAHAGYVHTT